MYLNRLHQYHKSAKLSTGIELLLGSTPPSKWQYRMSPSELAKVYRQLDEYLSKGWVHPSTSLYGAPILFYAQKGWRPLYVYRLDYWALNK